MKGIWRWMTVEGLNLERFLRMAGESGIFFARVQRNGRKLRLLVPEEQIQGVLKLAERGGWRCVEGRRQGLGRGLDALRRRWMLPAAALLCMMLVALGMQVMWRVEIHDAGSYQADVETFLRENGIVAPMWKQQVNPAELRDALEWRYPRIAWAECGWRGTTLSISLVQGVAQGETAAIGGSGDVVAARDGVIDSIVTAAGTPQVQAGDMVQAGQVLIAGYERGEGDTQHPVMARGTVMARVWERASVRVSCMENETRYTGRQQCAWKINGPWFTLTPQTPSPYETQDLQRSTMPLGGLFFPFTLVMEQRMEAEVIPQVRNFDEVQAEAGAAALRLLQEKMDFHDDLVDKWVDYCMIEGEVVEAVAHGERLMNIALPKRRQ